MRWFYNVSKLGQTTATPANARLSLSNTQDAFDYYRKVIQIAGKDLLKSFFEGEFNKLIKKYGKNFTIHLWNGTSWDQIK